MMVTTIYLTNYIARNNIVLILIEIQPPHQPRYKGRPCMKEQDHNTERHWMRQSRVNKFERQIRCGLIVTQNS